jgi:hypothetical protein
VWVTDSLLQAFAPNWSQATEVWGGSLGARSLRTDRFVAVSAGWPAFIVNSTTLLAPLEPEDVDSTMAAIDDHYGFPAGASTGRVFIFSFWPTPDLTSHGWKYRIAPLMLRPVGGELPAPPPGLRVQEVRDLASLRAAEVVTVRGFGPTDPELQQPGVLFGPALLDDPRFRMWVGWADDQPVSTSATFIAEGINNVINVATIPEALRRGYGAAVTWHATRADPSLPTLLVASDQGQPVYEKMGYQKKLDITLWSRKSPEE